MYCYEERSPNKFYLRWTHLHSQSLKTLFDNPSLCDRDDLIVNTFNKAFFSQSCWSRIRGAVQYTCKTLYRSLLLRKMNVDQGGGLLLWLGDCKVSRKPQPTSQPPNEPLYAKLKIYINIWYSLVVVGLLHHLSIQVGTTTTSRQPGGGRRTTRSGRRCPFSLPSSTTQSNKPWGSSVLHEEVWEESKNSARRSQRMKEEKEL